MNVHLLWLWFWFLFGAHAYIGKRAFYLIKGPNPVANNFREFVKVAGVPIAFRLLVDSAVYWALFTPEIAQSALTYLGWNMAAGVIGVVTQYGVFALFFGLGVDPMVDWAIGTVISKIPFLKDWWPQMPPPLVSTKDQPPSGS